MLDFLFGKKKEPTPVITQQTLLEDQLPLLKLDVGLLFDRINEQQAQINALTKQLTERPDIQRDLQALQERVRNIERKRN